MRVTPTLLTVAMVFLLSACASQHQQISSSDIDWEKRAKEVPIGMTRGEVDKILPVWDGPKGSLLTAPRIGTTTGSAWVETYWVSRDWRVTIIYDNSGGEGSEHNRVRDPVEVEKIRYESAM